jgi:hypothetical protein
MPDNFNTLIAQVTGGRRYCFVVMSYQEGFPYYEKLHKIVTEITGFECIRADDLPAAGSDLRGKIHSAIDNAVFVLGDLSIPRPNIYYEVGYAVARGKSVLLIAKEHSDIHTDLHGLEMIKYKDDREGWQHFEQSLRQHLEIYKDSNISLLSAMVLPSEPAPSFILINPKQLQKDSQFKHHPKEFKTYGDYLGISGIMGAFASVYRENVVPEIVNAAYANKDIINRDANLFLIGSPKVNRFTRILLKKIQNGKSPNWHFEKCAGKKNSTDYEMKLVGKLASSRKFQTECIGDGKNVKSAKFEDYGLIVRGNHPQAPGRTILILAGPHSVGTGSACLAATKTLLIQEIKKKLGEETELTDHKKTIWVLTKGVTDNTGHLDIAGVTIEETGVM